MDSRADIGRRLDFCCVRGGNDSRFDQSVVILVTGFCWRPKPSSTR